MNRIPTILGVAGGLVGLYIGYFLTIGLAFATVFAARSFMDPSVTSVIKLGFLAILLPVLGILGGALASYSLRLAGIFMLTSCIGSSLINALAISMIDRLNSSWIISFIFFVAEILCLAIGGILALRTSRKQPITSNITPSQA
ncbi:hypothetical protein HY230_07375 [Candidatus Acetothermia bacterium]|nr:hypothetical protein [Candidatus Acetothermia bacterium]